MAKFQIIVECKERDTGISMSRFVMEDVPCNSDTDAIQFGYRKANDIGLSITDIYTVMVYPTKHRQTL